ncbi:MAG: MerR family transcriptional regulator [Syntrophales bacterium]|nr:MerR family transcriptional regulator [Syntrophales bacterium]
MEVLIPDKVSFRIGEVSRILKVKPYVIRYWESEFKTIKPRRTTAGHRVYSREHVEELLLIRRLLYEEHFTIRGAKEELKVRRKKSDAHVLEQVKAGLEEIRDILNR